MTETKRERFDRIAPKRIANVKDSLRLLHNLTNRSSYAWDGEQMAKAIGTLRRGLDKIAEGFGVEDAKPAPDQADMRGADIDKKMLLGMIERERRVAGVMNAAMEAETIEDARAILAKWTGS